MAPSARAPSQSQPKLEPDALPSAAAVPAGPSRSRSSSAFLTTAPLSPHPQQQTTTTTSTGAEADAVSGSKSAYGGGATRPKRERKKKAGHMPRPANSWILYRSAQIEKLKQNSDLSRRPQSEVSRLIGYMWRDESPAVRKQYEEQAAIKKAEHAAMYPNYVYAPVRKEAKNKTSAASTSASAAASTSASAAAGGAAAPSAASAASSLAERAGSPSDEEDVPPSQSMTPRRVSARVSAAKPTRPAQKRGRAFTSPNLAQEGRMPNRLHPSSTTQPLLIPGTGPTAASSHGAHSSSYPDRPWLVSGMSDYSQFSHSLDDASDSSAAIEAWNELNHSALNFYPQHHSNHPQHPQHHAHHQAQHSAWSGAGAGDGAYWNLPPLSAPAAVARFNFEYAQQPPVILEDPQHAHGHSAQGQGSAPPLSAGSAATGPWSVYAGSAHSSSAQGTAPTSAGYDALPHAHQAQQAAWREQQLVYSENELESSGAEQSPWTTGVGPEALQASPDVYVAQLQAVEGGGAAAAGYAQQTGAGGYTGSGPIQGGAYAREGAYASQGGQYQ